MKAIVSTIKDMLILSVFLLPAVLAPMEAKAASLADAAGFAQATGVSCNQQKISKTEITMDRQAGRVSKLSMTKDCKYPIYDLQGDLEDLNYSSKDGQIIWTTGEIGKRLVFIEPRDVDHGYTCGFVCKDTTGNIVGINPSYKKILKRK